MAFQNNFVAQQEQIRFEIEGRDESSLRPNQPRSSLIVIQNIQCFYITPDITGYNITRYCVYWNHAGNVRLRYSTRKIHQYDAHWPLFVNRVKLKNHHD